jgi:hypothetical protein
MASSGKPSFEQQREGSCELVEEARRASPFIGT